MHDDMRRWLEAQLAPLSRVGVRLGVQPSFRCGEEIAAQQSVDALLDDARWDEVRVASARARLPQVPDIGQTLLAAAAQTLDLVDLARLAQFLDFFTAEYAHWHERTAQLGGRVIAPEHLEQLQMVQVSLRNGMTGEGYVVESAGDPVTTTLRSALREVRNDFDAWCGERLSELRALGVAAAHQAEFLMLRAGAALLEQPEVSARIRIARETPDFLMCALRYDESALRMLSHANLIERELSEAETFLFEAYGKRIVEANAALDGACAWVAELDIRLARRAFTVRFGLHRVVVTENRTVECSGAYCIPMREKIGPRYTPLDLRFTDIAVLSGANMGGKTCALKTLALLAHCVARGLPVPAASARVPIFERVLRFGDTRKHEDERLSAFGVEMTELRDILETVDEHTLVLLDEVARTTTPREGRALCIAVLRALRTRGAAVVAATHFDRVAERCGAVHFRLRGIRLEAIAAAQGLPAAQLLRNLEDAFDRRFERVDESAPERSQAFRVAEALGIAADVVALAESEYAQ